jgi:hypothetical protein
MLAVLYTLEHLVFSSFVANELVRHYHSWNKALLLEELAEESLGCLRISLALHQDVEHLTFTIHCSPQVILLSFDCDNNLIEMPFIG